MYTGLVIHTSGGSALRKVKQKADKLRSFWAVKKTPGSLKTINNWKDNFKPKPIFKTNTLQCTKLYIYVYWLSVKIEWKTKKWGDRSLSQTSHQYKGGCYIGYQWTWGFLNKVYYSTQEYFRDEMSSPLNLEGSMIV